MNTKDAARATSPPLTEERSNESTHTKEKMDKSGTHHSHNRKHGHTKKSKQRDSSNAKALLLSTTAAAAAAGAAVAVEEENWDQNRSAVEQLCAQYPNNVCCDCGESGTRWASVNHGVFVCIRCSGVHRSLGTHISKVKSTNMDRWSRAEVRLLEAIGNSKGKTLYEARLPAGTRPTLSSNSNTADDALKSFIHRKYVDYEFAMHNLKNVLGRLYEDTGYGRPPKKPSRVAAPREEPPLDRAAITGKRGDALRALYGDNAEEMQCGATKRKKGGVVDVSAGAAAAAAVPKPTYGAFGLVNVPADEYEARWKRTLEVFTRVEATAMAGEEKAAGGTVAEKHEEGEAEEEVTSLSSLPVETALQAAADDGEHHITEIIDGDQPSAAAS